MENSDENLPVDELCTLIADSYFEMVGEINPKIIQFFNELALKEQKVSEVLTYPNIFSDVIYKLSIRNKSGTIRELSIEEAKWVSRPMVLFNRWPFIEEDPIAGTEEHRRIAIDNMIRLLKNKSSELHWIYLIGAGSHQYIPRTLRYTSAKRP